MAKWLSTARYMAKKHGRNRALSWIKANVPEQLRTAIGKQI